MFEGAFDVLLDYDDRRVELRDTPDLVPDDVRVGGGKAGGRLVKQDDGRVDHERTGDSEEVLLAAGEKTGFLLLCFVEVGEDAEDLRHARSRFSARSKAADLEVLPHREALEDVVVLRHVDEAVAGDLVTGHPRDVHVVHGNTPRHRPEDPDEGLREGGLARSVGPDDRRHRPEVGRQRDVVDDGGAAVTGAYGLSAQCRHR